jgi:two-component system cell cycle sensor histidine kinase/response regulator CckA
MQIRLTADDKVALRAFWRFYQPRSLSISERTRASLSRSEAWSAAVSQTSRDESARQERESLVLQGRAILEDEWEPLLELWRSQGEQYAVAGFSYAAWFELLGTYRDVTRDDLAVYLQQDVDLQRVVAVFEIARGLNRFVDLIAGAIGEAYLATKQRTIALGEERYRTMFERSPQPMWMFECDTLRIVDVNDAAVRHYGYSREEFLSLTLADIRPSEDVAAMKEQVAREAAMLSDDRTWRHRKKDGTIIHVDVRASELVVDGKIVRLVQVTDVTARVRAEEALRKTEDQLRHAQKMEAIGRLAGGIAHDFNNVMTVIQTCACLLEEAIDPADARHEDAAEIRRSTERATGITRQLLTLSRHGKTSPRSTNLDDSIAGFLPMMRRLVGDSITIVTHRGNVPRVIVDPGQIEQVLMNLAVNARDAMADGGRLTIETRSLSIDEEAAAARALRPGRYIEVAVTDTGTGMDAETRLRIFDPFFTTKEAGKGTGLGLSIVHGIVSQAGGAIMVYSELGHGTTFRIHLPVGESEILVPEQPSICLPQTVPPVRVLVVDDQQGVRAVAARILKAAGCHVIEAASADEARRICVHHEEPIDVALLDVVLPDGRGEALIRQLRDVRPAMKFVQMSGYPAGALSPNGAAPIELLAKPFTPAELRAAIASVCADRSAHTKSESPIADTEHRRALVADDDGEVRRFVVRLLRRANFEVVDVDTGFKAITALETESFDVVVSDVNMPDGGGLDLLRAVRRVDLDVPVILMSGAPSLEAAAAAVEYGAFRFLTKPVDSVAFVKDVEHAARAHALARVRREAFNVSGNHAGVVDRAGLEVRFELAVEQMWMAFQPITHAGTGALFGVEALMRTTEPSMPNPGALLDAATQLGRLPLLGRRVRGLSAQAFATRADEAALFVNLHPEDLDDAELLAATAPLTAIAPRVILEVTERASLDSCSGLGDRIARLRKLGFRIAVDDIGAGYSGLTSFTELTPEVVKIDMSLVRDVHKSTLKQRTIGALTRLCHEIGTLVVAEGVETVEERDCVIALECDLLQGYLLGKPSREPPR